MANPGIEKYLKVVIDWFACVSWSEWCQFISAVATVVLAFLAWKGLTTWKRQELTQKKIQFVDELVNSVTEYVFAMGSPISVVGFTVEIGIKAYSHDPVPISPGKKGENDGFIRYIEAQGQEHGKTIYESLAKVKPLNAKMQSLLTKGQILGFKGYDECYKAGQMLALHFRRIDGLATIISIPTISWENEQVQETLNLYRNISQSEINNNLQRNSVKILEFANNSYQYLLS